MSSAPAARRCLLQLQRAAAATPQLLHLAQQACFVLVPGAGRSALDLLPTQQQPNDTPPPRARSGEGCSVSPRAAALQHALVGAQQRRAFSSLSSSAPAQSKKFSQRRLVGWTPEQLYAVVSDVDQYSKFVPWCQRSVVTKRQPDARYLEAELEVGFQVLVERYVSQVTLHPGKLVQSKVHDSLLFHHLDSTWSMEQGPAPNTCWLSFNVDFAFNNALYGHLADVFFSEVVQRMVGAFESRCQQLYGPSSLLRPPHTATTRPAANAGSAAAHKQQQQQRPHMAVHGSATTGTGGRGSTQRPSIMDAQSAPAGGAHQASSHHSHHHPQHSHGQQSAHATGPRGHRQCAPGGPPRLASAGASAGDSESDTGGR